MQLTNIGIIAAFNPNQSLHLSIVEPLPPFANWIKNETTNPPNTPPRTITSANVLATAQKK